ncbi:Hsp20/alpha crystallin family protein [Segetibacter koreensis]|uniref:Hsp20/alpha crystallin family protein n=1 Tax=Segetibacter koreensis TaxID=398037 RepID=UPI0003617AE9|nr:Hsp20/alpha crystallin family protein [Segetibacter koreensis]
MATNALTRPTRTFPSVFDDFFKPWNEWFDKESIFPGTVTVPAVNIAENEKEYKVSVAAPGLKKEDFKIDVEGNMIAISSEKEEEKEEKEGKSTRREYNYSSFSRSFTLPEDVNKDSIAASYTDGVLQLILPKKEEVKKTASNKQIAVQ